MTAEWVCEGLWNLATSQLSSCGTRARLLHWGMFGPKLWSVHNKLSLLGDYCSVKASLSQHCSLTFNGEKRYFPKASMFFLTSKILEGLALGEIGQRGGEFSQHVIPFLSGDCRLSDPHRGFLGDSFGLVQPPPSEGCGIPGTASCYSQRALQAHSRRVPDGSIFSPLSQDFWCF